MLSLPKPQIEIKVQAPKTMDEALQVIEHLKSLCMNLALQVNEIAEAGAHVLKETECTRPEFYHDKHQNALHRHLFQYLNRSLSVSHQGYFSKEVAPVVSSDVEAIKVSSSYNSSRKAYHLVGKIKTVFEEVKVDFLLDSFTDGLFAVDGTIGKLTVWRKDHCWLSGSEVKPLHTWSAQSEEKKNQTLWRMVKYIRSAAQ